MRRTFVHSTFVSTSLLLGLVTSLTGCVGDSGDSGDPGADDLGAMTEAATKCSDSGHVVYGVDVSGYQGTSINWGAVKASGRVFGFAKASEGTGFVDGSFAHNWPGMKSAGVLRGAYAFFRPSVDGAAQADLLIDTINAHGGLQAGDLPPVIDVEVSDSQSPARVVYEVRRFLDRVKARTGRTGLIYTANFFWGSYLGNPNFSGYPLWVANYGPSCPYLPNAWADWRFWQYTDAAHVSGIPGGVDGNMFNGTIDQLRAFAGATGGGGGGGGGGTTTGGFQTSRRANQNADGRLELFARAPDQAIWHTWQGAANGSWGAWASLGGKVSSEPVVSEDADGRLEVWVIAGGHLFHTFQLVGGGWYKGWLDEGNGTLVGEPAALLNSNGTLEVFARTSAGNLLHKWQTTKNGDWSAWANLGGVLHSDAAVGRNGDGRLELFVLGTDDRLYHNWQTTPHGAWSGWSGFGGITLRGTPHVGANADGRLEAIATGTDGRLHHIAQIPGGGWSAWIDAGTFTVTGEPAVSRNGDGRLEVFARGTDNRLWHLWQTAANSGWTTGASFGGTALASPPDAAPNADGRLEVFWRAAGGNIESVVQLPGGGWSGVVDFHGNLSAF